MAAGEETLQMIYFGIILLMGLIWWPWPHQKKLPSLLTGLIFLLMCLSYEQKNAFVGIMLASSVLIAWIMIIQSVLVRHFQNMKKRRAYNLRVVLLLLLNIFIYLPLLDDTFNQVRGLNRFILIAAGITDFLATTSLIIFAFLVLILQQFSKANPSDVLLVLGAGLKKGKVGTILAERLNRAIECWLLNKKAIVIVSGGILHGEETSQAEEMTNYLIQAGVYAQQIIQENQAKNTRQNLIYTEKLIKYYNLQGKQVRVVTSSFHLPRTWIYLHQLGLHWQLTASRVPLTQLPLTVTRDYLGIIRDHKLLASITAILIVVVGEIIM